MKVFWPEYFVDSEHMDGGRIVSSVAGINRAVRVASDFRAWRSFFTFNFGSVSAASTFSFLRRAVNPPWDIEITAVQLVVYAATGVTVSLDIAPGAGGAGTFRTLSVTGKGATEWSSFEKVTSLFLASGSSTLFRIATDGDADVQLHVQVRYRRDTYGSDAHGAVREGAALVRDGVNTVQSLLANADADAASLVAGAEAPRIVVLEGPTGTAFGSESIIQLLDVGEKIVKMTGAASGSGGGSLDLELDDDGGTNIATLSLALEAAASASGALSAQMAGADIADSASDYSAQFSIGSGTPTVTQSYAVLYLE